MQNYHYTIKKNNNNTNNLSSFLFHVYNDINIKQSCIDQHKSKFPYDDESDNRFAYKMNTYFSM